MEILITIIGTALAALAPSVAKAITGGQTPEEAVSAGRAAAKALPDRTDVGEDDLDERLKRG